MVIINVGYRGGRYFPGVPKLVVTFYSATLSLPGYQNFLPQILKSKGTKTCSYFRKKIVIFSIKNKKETKAGKITITITIYVTKYVIF